MIRKGDDSKGFREALQNPPKPINDTSTSPEMQNYLDNLNNNKLKSEATKKKEAEDKAKEEDESTLFCPTCKRATLKRAPIGFSCGYCGLHTNSPLRMAVNEAAREQQEE